MRVYACALLVFPMSSLFSAFLHTPTHRHTHMYTDFQARIHTQTFKYILSNIFRFFLIRCCSSESRVLTHTHNYTHTTHTHLQRTGGWLALSLSLKRSLALSSYTDGRGGPNKTTLVAAPCKKIDFAVTVGKVPKVHKFASQVEFN